MPRGDGTGPPGGSGPGTGRGQGRSSGGGRRQPGGSGLGIGGECVCPSCKTVIPHQPGVACNQLNCPKCGSAMTRK